MAGKSNTKKIRSFLKWAGNKYNCLDEVLSFFPEKAKRFIEPFTGSAAVFLNVHYDSYLLAEANKDLVSLFHHIKREGEPFIDFCQTFFTPDNNKEEQYYIYREQFNKLTHSALKSALFLYLNRHGYNGLCRYNSKGGFNVPFGRYIKPYFPRAEMQYFFYKSQKAEFIENDFRKTFKLAEPGDLIYCDPPYVPLTSTARFSSYTKLNFSENEQLELAELARDAAANGSVVVLSNHDTEFTRDIYHGAKIKSFLVNRLISCKHNKRRPVRELLAVYKKQ